MKALPVRPELLTRPESLHKKLKMSLELLIGPMFAGKSSAIQSIVRRHQSLGWAVFVVTNAMDTRYSAEPMVVNHDKQMIPAVAFTDLMPALERTDYKASRLVVIEEAQFFADLLPFVQHVVDVDKKHCVVVGLDGDAERRPFGRVLELVPHCDRVTKLTSMCKACGDGTPALFTFATGAAATAASEAGVPCVGGAEAYIPLCRKHYLQSRFPCAVGGAIDIHSIHAC
jgi:thymidine kinase